MGEIRVFCLQTSGQCLQKKTLPLPLPPKFNFGKLPTWLEAIIYKLKTSVETFDPLSCPRSADTALEP